MSGRPSKFTAKLAAEICEQLRLGKSLREICRAEGMPSPSMVMRWCESNHDGFREQYVRAREAQIELMSDTLAEIADDGRNDWMQRNDPDNPGYKFNGEHPARSKLRVETRKWLMSKLLPKKYGDRVALEHSGPDGAPIQVSDDVRNAALIALVARVRERAAGVAGLLE